MELCKQIGISRPNFKNMVETYVGFYIFKFEGKADWDKVLTPKHIKYARTDTRILFLLYEKLRLMATSSHIKAMENEISRLNVRWNDIEPI